MLLKLCAVAPKSSVIRNLLSSLTEFHPVYPQLVFLFALFRFLLLLPLFMFDWANNIRAFFFSFFFLISSYFIYRFPTRVATSQLSSTPPKKVSFSFELKKKKKSFNLKLHIFGKSLSGQNLHLAKRYRPTLRHHKRLISRSLCVLALPF